MHYLTQNNLPSRHRRPRRRHRAGARGPRHARSAGHGAVAVARSTTRPWTASTRPSSWSPRAPTALRHRARVRAIKGDTPAALADVGASPEAAARLGAGPAVARQLVGQHRQVRSGADRLEPAAPARCPTTPEILLQIAAAVPGRQSSRTRRSTPTTTCSRPIAKNSAAHRGRADAHLSLGKQAEAIADYEAALAARAQEQRRAQQPGLGAGHVARRQVCATASGRSSWPSWPAK